MTLLTDIETKDPIKQSFITYQTKDIKSGLWIISIKKSRKRNVHWARTSCNFRKLVCCSLTALIKIKQCAFLSFFVAPVVCPTLPHQNYNIIYFISFLWHQTFWSWGKIWKQAGLQGCRCNVVVQVLQNSFLVDLSVIDLLIVMMMIVSNIDWLIILGVTDSSGLSR